MKVWFRLSWETFVLLLGEVITALNVAVVVVVALSHLSYPLLVFHSENPSRCCGSIPMSPWDRVKNGGLVTSWVFWDTLNVDELRPRYLRVPAGSVHHLQHQQHPGLHPGGPHQSRNSILRRPSKYTLDSLHEEVKCHLKMLQYS